MTAEPASALAALLRAAALEPDSPRVYHELGNLLHQLGQLPEAKAVYERALRLDPRFAAAAANLGNTLTDMGLLEDAEACYRRALRWAPATAEIHSNLGNLLKNQGRLQEASACYEASIRLQPAWLAGWSNLLLAMSHDVRHTPQDMLAQARRFGQHAQALAGPALRPAPRARRPEEPVRVGLVSGDFKRHPVGYFLESWLGHVDPARLELHAFPTTSGEDDVTARLKAALHGWHPLDALDDAAAARLIAGRELDILVDLSGHTGHNRLGVFAWRPAPVQVSWLGYFATTGLPQMDWLIADRESLPVRDQQHFTEQIAYLPMRLCFAAPAEAGPVSPLPALNNGHLTFGCFQALGKINDETIRRWAQVLKRCPGSRLRVQNPQLGDTATAAAFLRRVEGHGIAAARVDLHGRLPRSDYLAAHATVDVILDTSPYPGGTTTCEALWMGVPTLALEGDRMLSRQGAVLLRAAGLGDWVVATDGDYSAAAVAKTSDLHALAQLRAGLRDRVGRSPLFDGAAFGGHFTALMRQLADAASTQR